MVRFHGTPMALVDAHVRALGLVPVTAVTHPDDFETVFDRLLRAMRSEGLDGIVFGNIHLEDVRAWYEERTNAAGFRHHEPLWGEDPGMLAREFVSLGYRARVVSVHLELGRREWLGREVTTEWIEHVEAHGADACGEYGEYHTFVFDGPAFRQPVGFEWGTEVEMEGHALLPPVPAGA